MNTELSNIELAKARIIAKAKAGNNISMDEMMEIFSPKRRAEIEAEGARQIQEYRNLQELRKTHDLTQEKLAQKLGIKQATLSKMEKQGDMMLSTLRNYVGAMGGKVRLVVEFPNKPPVALEGFGDIE